MMRPAADLRRWGTANFVVAKTALRFSPTTRSQSASAEERKFVSGGKLGYPH